MSPRSLWIIILKIFGLYIFTQLFYPLSQVISFLPLSIKGQFGPDALIELSAMLFSLSIRLFMVIAFLFKSDWLIDGLRLTRGIAEEKLELNLHRSIVLRIVVIISGMFLFVESLPLLLSDVFTYYQNINFFNGFKRYPSGGYIIFNLVKMLVSFFMMSSSRLIVNFIEHKRKGKIKIENPSLPDDQ